MELKEGKIAVKLARESAEGFLLERKKPKTENLPAVFYEKRGAFVTLHTYPEMELRGCIGYPEPIYPLQKAICDCSIYACQDPRFEPVRKEELPKIIFEVSVLTKPHLIECKNPKDYPKNIKIGVDGLIVRKGFHSGLLLPQVATEHKLSNEEFLEHTCMKAGLAPDSWLDKECKIFKFQAEVFSEKKPNGEVIRK
ncbi:MAG: TIGR00296 family protein [Candidatus Aenigmatarchaeota archaeon]